MVTPEALFGLMAQFGLTGSYLVARVRNEEHGEALALELGKRGIEAWVISFLKPEEVYEFEEIQSQQSVDSGGQSTQGQGDDDQGGGGAAGDSSTVG